ncbi:MAG: hypothetical protein H0T46_13865 [Deltaproteobacteria bacterium]|nr:hypothetical protein [Deltaproteobacteria bacterium]
MSVFAQPAKPAAKGPAKPAAPACVGEGQLVYDPATKLVGACDYEDKNCAGVDPATGAVRPLTAPPKAASASAAHLSAAKDAVCVGAGDASCTKLGKKAKAALAKAFTRESQAINEGNPQPRDPEARVVLSDDKAFAILGYGEGDSYGYELWDVKKDKMVRVKAWTGDRDFRKQYASPVGFVGDLVVFTFAPCAGPCAESRLYTRAGKAVGKSFDGVGELLTLSPGVAVGFGQEGGAVTITARAKGAKVWNEGSEGAAENGLVFQHAGGLFLARAGTEGDKNVVEIFKLKPDASGKEARVTAPVCSM